MACLYKIYLLPEFLPYNGLIYLFGNFWTVVRKNREPNFDFGVGLKILGYEWVGTQGNIFGKLISKSNSKSILSYAMF